ncbi:protein LYK2-like [Aristolochia californica]|uniref:protein LYK2-like n=1 Tax=Aristolochia californica TaxID=171875 RepID=UPI0035DFDE06
MAVLPINSCERFPVFIVWAFFAVQLVIVQGMSSFSCNSMPGEAFGHRCDAAGPQNQQCFTFTLFYANSFYSSLSNLSQYLGLNRIAVVDASGLSKNAEILLPNQPLLIPIDCRCNSGYFQAGVVKTAIAGESFEGIAASLEGLTTCRAIEEKNPHLPPAHLSNKAQVIVPLFCACPNPLQFSQGTKLLMSYPVFQGDTASKISSLFNTSIEALLSANGRSGVLPSEVLVVGSTFLIPLSEKPNLAPLIRAHDPNATITGASIPVMTVSKKSSRRRVTMRKLGIYIGLSAVIIALGTAMSVIFLVIQRQRKKSDLVMKGDLELQQLTIGNPRQSKELEDPQDAANDQNLPCTPHKGGLDTFSPEELRKATEDFNSSNFIEGTMFHGRLNGKNLAIKQTSVETISKINFELIQENHRHPNILRLLGTCMGDGGEPYLVFEYAKNGSLKDWLHGGLAMKSQFIASCYCFLSWNQRLRICLHVAMALHYMHHALSPSHIHRNVKSRNILLDEEFNAKLGNFGMSRCTEDDDMEAQQLLSVSWSRGYLAPEYLEHGTISRSTDIFAYGVVLLEVLSGQTPIARGKKNGESSKLSEKIKSVLQSDEEEGLRGFMDSSLDGGYSFEAAMVLAKVARGCVEEDPALRPSAEVLVVRLARLVEELPEGEQFCIAESSSKPSSTTQI